MGSSNRDYMQDGYDSGQSPPSWGQDTPTSKWLLIVTVGVFLLQTILTHDRRFAIPDSDPVASIQGESRTVSRQVVTQVQMGGMELRPSYIEEWFALDANKVLHGQVWRLFTYFFCSNRATPFSLAFNMIALWYLGTTLERMYGSRELLWFYVASGIAAGLMFVAFGLTLALPFPLMGSGPCVMALVTLYATHFPTQEILFCWVVPVQIRVLLGIYVAIDVYTILNAYSGQASWVVVAYMSDLWGIAFGYFYRRWNGRLSRFGDTFNWSRMRRAMRRADTARSLKVFHPEPPSNLEEQVDAILAKIHEHGSESLTDRERSVLQKASEKAKNRT